jgi:hypothetical protein
MPVFDAEYLNKRKHECYIGGRKNGNRSLTAATAATRPITFTTTPQRQNVIQEIAKPIFGTDADV